MTGIVRVFKKEDPFARIPQSVLTDKDLSWKAKGLLCYLLGKPSDWKVRVADLVNQGPDGEDAVLSGLRELREHGYATLTESRENGQYSSREWVIYDARQNLPELGFPVLVKPVLGNQSITKNDSTKNELNISTGPLGVDLASRIYEAYPRKVKRPVALRAIRNALKKIGFEQLLTATQQFAEAVATKEPQFIPYPATFFNSEQFNDDPSTWNPSGKPQQPDLISQEISRHLRMARREEDLFERNHGQIH